MANAWYPQDKNELNEMLEGFLKSKRKIKEKIQGIIVPHAGYAYSGKIAGKAYSMLKGKRNKLVVIIGPSHYFALREIAMHNQKSWKTPFGDIKIAKTKINFTKANFLIEHAIDNQIPFLQKLGFKEILPLIVGEISEEQAKDIAKKLAKINAIFIFSSDLSHFLSYEEAVKKDKEAIRAIENLDIDALDENSACGIFPFRIFMELAKIKRWKPRLIEYKNSGDVTGDKSSVVGYASFYF